MHFYPPNDTKILGVQVKLQPEIVVCHLSISTDAITFAPQSEAQWNSAAKQLYEK